MTMQPGNNAVITCDFCGAQITKVCMLSPDYSAMDQFKCALEAMRQHNEKAHGIQRPPSYGQIQINIIKEENGLKSKEA